MCSAKAYVRFTLYCDRKSEGFGARVVNGWRYYFAPLWQFAWQTVMQLALRFAISHFFEHFSKHACADFCANAEEG